MIEATRSIAECAASVTIAIEPVIAPATSLAAISSEFEATETHAAPALVPLIAPAPARHGSARAARPRWLIACLPAGSSSAIVRVSPGPVSSGTNAGS